MSNAVYPSLPGLAFGVTKAPTWSTRVQTAVSGKEHRAGFWAYPLWKYSLTYEFLYADAVRAQLQTLLGFFNARQGQFDSFLFNDPDDNAVTAQLFGTGDGVTTAFQLMRSYGGYTEPVKDLNGAPQISKAGVVQGSGYSVSATGLVTFTAAPASGAALTWTGAYYWRVRFAQDALEVSKFMALLWDAKQVQLVGVKT